jgi:hypothetical protein
MFQNKGGFYGNTQIIQTGLLFGAFDAEVLIERVTDVDVRIKGSQRWPDLLNRHGVVIGNDDMKWEGL